MSQMKEQDKTSEEQLSDVEIGNLPETEFRVIWKFLVHVLLKLEGF